MNDNDKSKIVRAFEEFNKVSLNQVSDVETFSKLISLSPKVRKGYNDGSFQNSAFSQMPESFYEKGITPEQGTEVEKALPRINSVRKRVSDAVEAKAAEFRRFVEAEEAKCNDELAKLESPLIKILKVNITCLDLKDQLEILASPSDKKDMLEKSKLEDLRRKLLDDLSNGKYKDPFVHGDYKDLLI